MFAVPFFCLLVCISFKSFVCFIGGTLSRSFAPSTVKNVRIEYNIIRCICKQELKTHILMKKMLEIFGGYS